MTNALITFYCSCRLCCGPDACGLTASGVPPAEGITAAANGYPFGTILNIETLGLRVVQDRMAKRFGKRRVDVYVAKHDEAKRLGIMPRNVSVVPAEKIEWAKCAGCCHQFPRLKTASKKRAFCPRENCQKIKRIKNSVATFNGLPHPYHADAYAEIRRYEGGYTE